MSSRSPLDGALIDALRTRADAHVIARLLNGGADPNAALPREEGGFRPLHVAVYEARASSVGVVEALLERGADPNGLAAGGQSPLLVAVGSPRPMWTEQLDVIRGLLAAGANPNHANELGHTPLMYAVANTLQGARLLLEAGANANARDGDGWHVLDWVQNYDAERALADLAGVSRSAEAQAQFFDRETPVLVDTVGDAAGVLPADPARTAGYLAAGYPVLEYMTDDSVLTDGKWAWRRGFAQKICHCEARLPRGLAAFIEARAYRMPFLDPMKLYLKTMMAIGEWGATYPMTRSMYDYLHQHFCRAPAKPS